MKVFFDSENFSFFPSGMRSSYESRGSWPLSAVLLTDAERDLFFCKPPPFGQRLSTDKNGRPVFIDIPPPTAEEQAAMNAAEAKRVAQTAVNDLTVDVDGLIFKANDKSIGRMVAAILDAQTTGDTSTIWKMTDGSSQLITLEQLKTAQSLAIRAVGALVV